MPALRDSGGRVLNLGVGSGLTQRRRGTLDCRDKDTVIVLSTLLLRRCRHSEPSAAKGRPDLVMPAMYVPKDVCEAALVFASRNGSIARYTSSGAPGGPSLVSGGGS